MTKSRIYQQLTALPFAIQTLVLLSSICLAARVEHKALLTKNLPAATSTVEPVQTENDTLDLSSLVNDNSAQKLTEETSSDPEDSTDDNLSVRSVFAQVSPSFLANKKRTGEQTISTSNLMITGSRNPHIIHMPNGQSYQFCDDTSTNGDKLKCIDENAVCTLGACVCKPDFFQNRQSGQCQSISDLFKNCENDHQCQAFSVDMICDTSTREKPFCNCPSGLYFDEETHTCVPCLSDASGGVKPTSDIEDDQTANTTRSSQLKTNVSSKVEPPTRCKTGQTLRSNLDQQLQRLHQRLQSLNFKASSSSSNLDHLMPHVVDFIPLRHSTIAVESQTRHGPTTSTSSTSSSSSVDPFRIKTPLEVVISAIMLFTLLTVAWFFLQRMVHDCRAIMRSLRNPSEYNSSTAGGATTDLVGVNGATDLTYTGGPLASMTFGPGGRPLPHQYALDPTGQAVASAIYQRDLAGIMVQHLTANLSPSSTNQALMAVAAGGRAPGTGVSAGSSDYEAALYPVTNGDRQSRNAAATAAAAQFLLSPSHPAIAILRAAAAAAQTNGTPTDYHHQVSPNPMGTSQLLTSMFDPPPKYEEAIAQQAPNYIYYPQMPSSPSPSPQPQSHQPQAPGSPHATSLEQIAGFAATQELSDQVADQQSADELAGMAENLTGSREFDTQQQPNNTLSIFIPPDETRLAASAEDLVMVANSSNNVDLQQSPEQVSNQTPQRLSAQQVISAASNPSARKANRRSRRDRNSMSRGQQRQQQQQNQDSDDTLTET